MATYTNDDYENLARQLRDLGVTNVTATDMRKLIRTIETQLNGTDFLIEFVFSKEAKPSVSIRAKTLNAPKIPVPSRPVGWCFMLQEERQYPLYHPYPWEVVVYPN